MKKQLQLILALTGIVPILAYAEESALSPDDIAIMTIALRHFSKAELQVELISEHGDVVDTNRTEVIIARHTLTNGVGFLSDTQLNSFTERGREQIRPLLSSELTRALRSRVPHAVSLAPVSKADPTFVIVNATKQTGWFADMFPNARAYAEPWLPGYNSSKDDAIFTFMFGPRHHPTQALYKMKRGKDGWVIEWHQFNYYL